MILLWGKQKGRLPLGPAYHPLVWHALDAAAVAERLWEDYASAWFREAFVAALGLSDDKQGCSWFSFLTSLHDYGKSLPGFAGAVPSLRRLLRSGGFIFPTSRLSQGHERAGSALVAGELSGRFGVPGVSAQVLASAVSLDRGCYVKPHVIADLMGLVSPTAGGSSEDLWQAARRDLVDVLAVTLEVRDRLSVAVCWSELSPLVAVLTGLVKVADWSASDPALFPFMPPDGEPRAYLVGARQRAAAATATVRLHGWHAPLGDSRPLAQVLGVEALRDVQEVVAAAAGSGGRLVVVEDEPGAGKTEAAYGFVHRQMQFGATGLYLAMPTRATSNQSHARLSAWLKMAGLAEFAPILLHGHASLTVDADKPDVVAGAGAEAEDGEATEPSRWFRGPHRGLFAHLGTGTVDQILLMAQSVRYAPVRFAGLSGRVVVFDEVHAYDAYMNRVLERALQWLAQIGCPVVLLSATLPPATRRALTAAYRQGLLAGEEPIVEEDETPGYPRVTVTTVEGSRTFFPKPARPARTVQLRRFAFQLGPAMTADPARVAAELDALTAADRWGRIAVVCNSVDHAQRLYLTVRDRFADDLRVRVVLFHARFPHDRREELEREVLGVFGKRGVVGRRDELVILIATQIVEQSLDIDADLLITEFTVVDLLAQRMGRLHRWESTPRPPWAQAAVCWLLEPHLDRDGLPALTDTSFVYDDTVPTVLLGTWMALRGRDQLELPTDVTGLVADVYEAADAELPPWEAGPKGIERWREALGRHRANVEDAVEQAEARMVPEPWDLDAWCRLTWQARDDDIDGDLGTYRAMTRLGPPSLTVVLTVRREDGLHPVAAPTAREPSDPAAFPDLLRSSVALSRPSVVRALQGGVGTRPSWRREPRLARAALVEFDPNGDCAGRHFRYSREFGVMYPDQTRRFVAEGAP